MVRYLAILPLLLLLLASDVSRTVAFLPTTIIGVASRDNLLTLSSRKATTTTSTSTNGRFTQQSSSSSRNTFLSATVESDSSSSASKDDEVAPSAANDWMAQRPRAQYDSIICGGGPAGLLSAIMLSQKYGPNHKIAVCERRPTTPPSPSDEDVWNDVARFYLLGIGHRGQRALKEFGVFEDFEKASVAVEGRRDWQPGMTKVEDGRITPAKKDVTSRVLARDKLVGVLHHHLVENYIANNAQIDLLYGYEVEPIHFGTKDEAEASNNDDDGLVRVRITKCEEFVFDATATATATGSTSNTDYVASQDAEQLCDVESYQESTTKFLLGADGAARTVANAMEKCDKERYNKMNPLKRLFPFSQKPFKVTRFEDDNQRLFKSVPIRLPADWPKGLNYSARSRESRITLEALPSDDKGSLCALLLLKPDDEFTAANSDPTKLRAFFEEEFPQFGALIDDDEMARVAKKPATALPAFRYAGPRLHFGKRTLVLGDAAHTVKPYYGLGCNTALEDVQILSDILDEVAAGKDEKENESTSEKAAATSDDPIVKAVPLFSKRRAADAEALVTISRNMDRPGKLFFVNFLLPLILDGIFHKIAPRIFSPNMFGMFQRKDIGFKQIQRKKRLDRTLQVAILASMATSAGMAVKFMIGALARALGKSSKVVTLGLVLVGAMAGAINKAVVASKKESDDESSTSTNSSA